MSQAELYEKKRQMILDILLELGNHWHLSKSVHDFVQSSEFTPEIIDFLWGTIDDTLKEMEDDSKSESLVLLANRMHELRQKEENERQSELNSDNEIIFF